MPEKLGERLRMLMERRKLASEKALAKEARVTQSTISRLLNGATDPSLSTLRRVAKALKVTVSQLIGDVPIDDDDDVSVVLNAMEGMPSYKRGAVRTMAERLKDDP